MHPFGATLQLAVSYYVKWLFCGDDGGGIKAEFGRETNVGAAQRRVVDPTFIQHEACAGGDAPQKNRAGGSGNPRAARDRSAWDIAFCGFFYRPDLRP